MFPPECSHSSVPMFPRKTMGTFFLRVPTKKTVGTFCKWRQNAMFPCSHNRVPLSPRFRCINFTETTSGNTSILGVKNSKFLVIVNFC